MTTNAHSNPIIGKLVGRAQSTGDLRSDFMSTDVKMIVFMIASLARYTDPVAPGIWRRYLAMLIDGLRPGRDDVSPLPASAPTLAELEALMRSAPRR